MKPIRPMSASLVNIEQIKYPCYVSPKLDGIRGVLLEGKTLTKTFHSIPNKYTYNLYADNNYHGLDGEFIVGSPIAKHCYSITDSALMSFAGEPDVKFYVFDDIEFGNLPFIERLNIVKQKLLTLNSDKFILNEQILINSVDEFNYYEDMWVTCGYEGIIIRHPRGLYKYGRSTINQGWLLKMKRFSDSEAKILDCIELKINNNKSIVNALGYSKKSSQRENKVLGQTLGAFLVEDIKHGWVFEIGTGFSAKQRKQFWNDRKQLIGKIVTYKYFPYGMLKVPRHMSFKGFRQLIDM